jgi:uncharacterized protein (TIGR03032 family)
MMNAEHKRTDSPVPENNRDGSMPSGSSTVGDRSPLRSVVTESFVRLLSRFGVSLAVTTYQAGYVVVFRAESPTVMNTHFRPFPRPMGLAFAPGQVALGTEREVVEFRNMAALAAKLGPPHGHDACYLPRKSHITGDIDVHDMAYGEEGLWLVNTRFSSLCTLDDEHCFVPRWWPPFVTSLLPVDRCHLNGLAMVDGRPKYVTALGATDSREGWREDKVRGGVLIEIGSGEIITRGLSMPHSPRWHDGRLWLLESGQGTIGTVDLASGRYEPVARLDGYTRGLAFCGPYGLVGLSQVREGAVFSGIPLAERVRERTCGVAVIDTRSGQQVGYAHFEDAVQEIFAVELLPHRFPDILEPNDDLVASAYALPDDALEHVPGLEEKGHEEDQ